MPAARATDPVTPEEDHPVEERHEGGAEETDPAEAADPAPDRSLWNGDLPAAKGLVAKVFEKSHLLSRARMLTLFSLSYRLQSLS